MYSINSLNKINTPIRMLQTSQTETISQGKSINGNGAAGLIVVFLFLFVVIIGSIAMTGIFVNTKFVDTPLLLGKIEY
jgi:hypothetical protein